MSVSWDAVSALSSAASALVIAVTVIIGYRQIRLTRDQVAHLRGATQLEGTMKAFAELETAEFRRARIFIENELAARMQDERFRADMSLPAAGLDESVHPEMLVAATFEKIGTYARHGLLDTVLIADYCGPLIRAMWQRLDDCGYIAARRRKNPYALENFEYLYDAAMDWYENDDAPFRSRRRAVVPAASPPADSEPAALEES